MSILLTESYNCCSLTVIRTAKRRVGDGNQIRREILKMCIGRRSCKLRGSFSAALLQGMQKGEELTSVSVTRGVTPRQFGISVLRSA